MAQKAQEHLFSTGVADTAYFGPEPEFFVFDDVRFETTPNSSYYRVDSIEGSWNTGAEEEPNLGYKPRTKQGYFPVPPMDHYQDLRSAMMLNLHEVGIETELHHHEVASGGQGEIGIRFDTLLAMADKLMTFKYVLKSTAWAAGKSLTFMPKPVFEDNGSGMHTHQSLWKGGEPLFFDETGYAGLSDLARWYIGGLLHHAHAVIAFTNPTTNSFKRLVPGYEAPVNLVYSQRNRSASCRIPLASKSPRAKRVEFRCPDSTSNPYLAFSAMMLAGLDGIENRIEPPEPMDKDLYDLPPEELAERPAGPRLARGGAAGAGGGPGLPEGRWRVHRRPHRDLGQLQAPQRGRRPAPPSPPLRVHALLRHLIMQRAGRRLERAERFLERRARRRWCEDRQPGRRPREGDIEARHARRPW